MSNTPYFYIYKDNASEWRWHLMAANAKIIADSGEGYKNLEDCEHGVSLVKSLSQTAVTIGDDLYDIWRK